MAEFVKSVAENAVSSGKLSTKDIWGNMLGRGGKGAATSYDDTFLKEDIERINLILRLTREMGVNKAGVEIILSMKNRFEQLHQEVEDMMGLLHGDLRKEFEERLQQFFRNV